MRLEHSPGHPSERLIPRDQSPAGLKSDRNPSLSPAKREAIYTVERTRALTQLAQEQAERDSREAITFGDGITALEERVGRPLHHTAIRDRLQRLNPNILVMEGESFCSVVLVNQRAPKYLFGMERGYSPEFSVPMTNEKGELVDHKRGWRAVVARLIRMRLIPVGATERAFGIYWGRSSRKWRELITT